MAWEIIRRRGLTGYLFGPTDGFVISIPNALCFLKLFLARLGSGLFRGPPTIILFAPRGWERGAKKLDNIRVGSGIRSVWDHVREPVNGFG